MSPQCVEPLVGPMGALGDLIRAPLKHIHIHHISHTHTYTEHCTSTTHHTQKSHPLHTTHTNLIHYIPHTQITCTITSHCRYTHTNTEDANTHTRALGRQPSRRFSLALQRCLGDHLPPPAANHSHCHHHYHHCHRSRNTPHGQDVSESTQLCPQTKTSA